MSTETFNFEYDIDKLLTDWNKFYHQKKSPNFAEALEIGLMKGYEEVSEQVLERIMDNLVAFGLGDSNIITDVNVEITDEGVSIMINDDGYAIFVEYGTGVIGEDTPHPQAHMNGWVYDVNGHGEYGWWYPSKESDPNPTRYLSKDGTWWAWTRGQQSRPFMYLAWLWASRNATRIIDKHIRAEFRRLEREYK